MKIKDMSPSVLKLRNRLKRSQSLLRQFRQHRLERYKLQGNVFKVQWQLMLFAKEIADATLLEEERVELRRQIGLTLKEVKLLRESWLYQDLSARHDAMILEDEPRDHGGGLHGVAQGLGDIMVALFEPTDLDQREEELWELYEALA